MMPTADVLVAPFFGQIDLALTFAEPFALGIGILMNTGRTAGTFLIVGM